MWGFRSFNIRKPTHISNINLQVECAPLRKCARPRPAVCTGGAAKQEKDHNQHQQQPNILISKSDSLNQQNRNTENKL